MEGIFDISNGKVVISAEALAIPPFNEFWDSFKDKSEAEKEIRFCSFKNKWNSPYKAFDEEERESRILEHIYGIPTHTFSENYKRFEEEFIKFMNTPSTRLLQAAEKGIEFLIKDYNDLSDKQGLVDDKGKPLVDAGTVSRWLSQLGPAIKSYDQLKEQVKTENKLISKARGQSEIGFFERPRDKR